ncbi:MAG: GNAT family N-acetyltransferase [Rhodospirillaceae bacterium]|jgi:GNAT superfamily N-acetyltransferase|nr:GNAT family N-acetyltransferase [Rhodospirillaceae bacterium]MBT3932379.1 GNAT family N-acetyltransferase [Rhodospirillaceae bacterium]MBT4773361.1 GNAT family N-acetyltransferase [Rhodospirillaceae bacterium]MBT5359981.1 GNAT family N-acetyltransferase [Rhodospirillaceae bacterium]MBT5769822.1 GNAT family N-acetyltransferase [Rhodospirillaceae bacterium]
MASTLDNIEIRTLSAPDAGAFGKFTFPLLRHLVEDPPERDMVYIGAMTKTGEPVGLAFGMGGPDGTYELVSVYIGPFHRNLGIGTVLVNALHEDFAALGYPTGVQLFTLDADDQRYGKFLMRCGFARPGVRQLVCKTTLDLAETTPWLIRATVPDGYRVGLWADMTDAARADLKARKDADPELFPDSLNPFDFEEDCHLSTSVVLLQGEHIVGWIITHVLDDDTLRWTCSWVLTSIQGAGRIIPLWWEAVQRQRATTDLARFIWTVPMEEPRMAKFAARRMRPWLESMGYACTAVRR